MSSEASHAELYWRRIQQLVTEFDFDARILRFVAELYGPDVILNAWQEFRGWALEEHERTLFWLDSPFAKLFISWLAHSWKSEQDPEEEVDRDLLGLVPTEALLQRNPELDSLLYRYLETCTYSPLSFYEVLPYESEKALSCRDVLIGREYKAFGGTATESLKIGDIVYARLVEIDGISLLEVIAPVVFPAAFKSTILNFRELILEGAPVPTEEGHARQFLEDRELELRKTYWNLVYLAIRLVPPNGGLDSKPSLH